MSDMKDSLKTLHTRVIDSRDGYRNAVEDIDDKEVGAFLHRMIEERETFHAQIHETLRAEGIEFGEGGSTLAAAHRGLMDLRGAMSSGGTGVYAECARGDEKLLESYDAAIEATGGHPEWSFLTEQRAKVAAAIEAAKAKA
ncbi:DUF2383 domain-containing protein [Palleronia sp. LCG004]|uniref:DUF2383 domain-containing protein n=1 Tax=Palleronia sp. LCG004 TaxID=3079304 RepID=UPI0029431FB5|nr:DUF2383 domain-containing protein [Palleronia sp. LCG004]WOI58174.1 DUF2383 domain-containing protein [Palleronia sp. LCG004]